MEEKKLFTAPRWNDVPQATVVGHREISKEERKRYYRKPLILFMTGNALRNGWRQWNKIIIHGKQSRRLRPCSFYTHFQAMPVGYII